MECKISAVSSEAPSLPRPTVPHHAIHALRSPQETRMVSSFSIAMLTPAGGAAPTSHSSFSKGSPATRPPCTYSPWIWHFSTFLPNAINSGIFLCSSTLISIFWSKTWFPSLGKQNGHQNVYLPILRRNKTEKQRKEASLTYWFMYRKEKSTVMQGGGEQGNPGASQCTERVCVRAGHGRGRPGDIGGSRYLTEALTALTERRPE